MSVNASVRKLHRIRNLFTTEASREKLRLMASLRDQRIEKASLLKLFHASLCFIRAFPDDLAHHRLAVELLGGFLKRVKHLHRGERSSLAETASLSARSTRGGTSVSVPATSSEPFSPTSNVPPPSSTLNSRRAVSPGRCSKR